jgi:endonuclease-8
MPEGDTIRRAAGALSSALAGRRVEAFTSSLPAVAAAAERLGIAGRTVEAVESRGKHLLIRFEGGAVLHTHLRMQGRWRLYRGVASLGSPNPRARAVLRAGDRTAACFDAPVVELLSRFEARDHGGLATLGPDLLAPDLDLAAAVSRLQAAPDRPIGELLLDQRVCAGIGNVFRSEVLFLAGVHPGRRLPQLPRELLSRILETAREAMRRNLVPGPRRTRPGAGPRLWVYRRGGQRCLRCGEEIRRAAVGEPPRSCYWCPGCQPE